MNVELFSRVVRSVPASTSAQEVGKTEKAARDFESVLLTSLFDSLEKTFSWDSMDSSPGSDTYRKMGTRALAEAVSAGGGIGIARLILRHLPVTKVPGRS